MKNVNNSGISITTCIMIFVGDSCLKSNLIAAPTVNNGDNGDYATASDTVPSKLMGLQTTRYAGHGRD